MHDALLLVIVEIYFTYTLCMEYLIAFQTTYRKINIFYYFSENKRYVYKYMYVQREKCSFLLLTCETHLLKMGKFIIL